MYLKPLLLLSHTQNETLLHFVFNALYSLLLLFQVSEIKFKEDSNKHIDINEV